METTAFPVPAHHPDFDPTSLSPSALEDEITTLSACISVATWRLLMLIAELDRRGAWQGWGVMSCAHWLNWKCGIDLGAAREKVRVAKALVSLPLTSAALAAGEVSYSKVRAITRVATPESESYLLMIAHYGTASHVEKLVRAYRSVDRLREASRARDANARRSMSWSHEDDGSFSIRIRLPAEQGALVLKAVRAAAAAQRAERDGADREPSADVSAETSALRMPSANSFDEAESPAEARNADALCHIAEQFLANEATTSQQAERYQVVVHVDASALQETGHGERCHIEHGPALAAETARRLACDASIVTLDEDERGEPLNVGRRTRTIPPAIRRALMHRDKGCRFPGCLNHLYVDAHHIRHWADGGETRMENLTLLCRHHHGLLHEGGFTLEQRDDGKLLFFRPDGRYIPEVPKPALKVPAVESVALACGAHVSAETSRSHWDGGGLDLDIAVAHLQRRHGWQF
jgi:hypothetical protein